jgi:hypothetical protein
MPKLLRSSETAGCGATIKLDNGDVVYVSIAQISVLVRKWDMSGGFLKSLLSMWVHRHLPRPWALLCTTWISPLQSNLRGVAIGREKGSELDAI